jgi:hypothetical protein
VVTGRRLAAVTVGSVALVATLAACGIPRDAAPRDITITEEPFTIAVTTTIAETATGVDGAVKVFFVGTERLEPSNRPGPWSLESALGQLVAGPTQNDLDRGLQTRIPLGTQLLSVSGPDGAGVVTVDLSSEFIAVRGEAQTAAVAQVVFTVTDRAEGAAVRFLIDGEPQPVPTETSTSSEPVERYQYPGFNPTVFPEPAPPSPPSTSVVAGSTTVADEGAPDATPTSPD